MLPYPQIEKHVTVLAFSSSPPGLNIYGAIYATEELKTSRGAENCNIIMVFFMLP